MNPLEDPFQPGQEGQDTVNPAGIAQEWGDALKDPKVKSSLLSFGLQMLQPPQFGQTFMSQVAQGVGAAGETLTAQDEEARKDREQLRKEQDTSSQIDTRADTTDVKRGQLENQQLRTDISAREAASKAELRAAQAQVALSNVGKIQAQVEALNAKTALFPQDQQAKIDLARAKQSLVEAQAGLAAARTDTIAPVAASVVKKNEASAGLSEARTGQVGVSNELARLRLEQQDRRLTTQEIIAKQRLEQQDKRDYTQEKIKAQETHRKENELKPRAQQQSFSFPPYDQWTKQRSAAPASPQPAPTAPAAPVAPAATTPASTPASTSPDSQLPAFDPAKAATTPPGRYMTPKGPLNWNGTKFTQ